MPSASPPAEAPLAAPLPAPETPAGRLRGAVALRLPGVLVCGVIALASAFVSEHYGGPRLLYALLVGLAFHFLAESPRVLPGIEFCARTVLRTGVALLGVRITLGQVSELGLGTAVTVASGVVSTVLLGAGLARLLKRPGTEGVISGASVGICGASAALAVSSVLPATPGNQRFTLMAVVGVTVLSTLSMVLYPFVLHLLGLQPEQAGIVIGGTIHDVAQVVAAGMMLGPHAGDTATVVKLFRVMMLMPVVLVISVIFRARDVAAADAPSAPRPRVPLVPGFLLCFIALVALASLGAFSPPVVQAASTASAWMLVVAIAAAGVKTSFQDLATLGWQPVVMLVTETLFIALLVLGGVMAFSLGA